MIISRKRFEQEVRRRARRICHEKDMAEALELSAQVICQLEKRIRRLEKQNQKPKGEVKGFYIPPEQGVIAVNCSTTSEETHSLDNEG